MDIYKHLENNLKPYCLKFGVLTKEYMNKWSFKATNLYVLWRRNQTEILIKVKSLKACWCYKHKSKIFTTDETVVILNLSFLKLRGIEFWQNSNFQQILSDENKQILGNRYKNSQTFTFRNSNFDRVEFLDQSKYFDRTVSFNCKLWFDLNNWIKYSSKCIVSLFWNNLTLASDYEQCKEILSKLNLEGIKIWNYDQNYPERVKLVIKSLEWLQKSSGFLSIKDKWIPSIDKKKWKAIIDAINDDLSKLSEISECYSSDINIEDSLFL